MTRKLLGVWFHLEKNVQGGPATIGGVQDNEVYGNCQQETSDEVLVGPRDTWYVSFVYLVSGTRVPCNLVLATLIFHCSEYLLLSL